MTTIPDILGLDKCLGRKAVQDIVDRKGWELLEAKHPGILADAIEIFGAGSRPHIPRSLETPRAKARRLDDGKMTIVMLAAVAHVGYATAYRAREERESRT